MYGNNLKTGFFFFLELDGDKRCFEVFSLKYLKVFIGGQVDKDRSAF